MTVSSFVRATAAAGVIALAVTACGSSAPQKKSIPPSTTAASSTSVAQASSDSAQLQLESAAGDFNTAWTSFQQRVSTDSQNNDLTLGQGDASSFRTAVFNYDAAVRKISFPSAVIADVYSLEGDDRTAVADLDAASQASGVDAWNQAIDRLSTDIKAVIDANNKVDGELGGTSAGTSSPAS
jgi:hypothetical protein